MRIVAISVLALAAFTGCITLHAEVPEEMVRHIAREDGVELGAICSHEGRKFSEGSVVCMSKRQMICDPHERWAQGDAC